MQPKGMTGEEEEAGIPRERVIPQKNMRRKGAESVSASVSQAPQAHALGSCSPSSLSLQASPPLCFPIPQQKRKLRIYISNTFTPAKEEGEGGERVASWELRVEGKLLEDVRIWAGINVAVGGGLCYFSGALC